MALIDKVFKRILELDGNPRNRGDYGGKAYIRHCMEDHNGQVPLWVLANHLSFGQTVWFFQVQSPAVRLAVAESFTGLYADTHDGPRRITIKRLDSIFNRLVFYRNLCAHDERCYCARYDGRANENVYQAIGDLGYLLDKDDYLELFGRFSALVARATSAMPFWAVCNRPVGFGMDLGCHWRLGRLYGPRIVLSIVRHGDVLPGECFWAPPRRNIMKPQGVLHFSVPVGEDAERRQGGGTFPDYFWVPVGASWKTRLIGRFPKN